MGWLSLRDVCVLSVGALAAASALAFPVNPTELTFVLESPQRPTQADAPWPMDEKAYGRWLAQTTDKLAESAKDAPSADQREQRLRAARFALSDASVPALSRVLLNLATKDDCDALQNAVQIARRQLQDLPASASAATTQPGKAPTNPDYLESLCKAYTALAAHAAIRLRPDAESRRGVSASQAAASLPADVKANLSEACSELAGWLDDGRPGIAGPARLLQAACYRRMGRIERALEAVQAAPPSGLPLAWQVYTWCEYCLAQADGGNAAAAISLSIRIESGVSATAPLAHRTAAAFTLRAVRYRILQAWRTELRQSKNDEAFATTAEMLDRLSTSFGSRDGIALLRLTELP